VSGDRIGVLTNSGTFLVKQGGLSAQWTDEYNGVRAGLFGPGLDVTSEARHILMVRV